MALISQIPIINVATAVARALEELLGHDVILTTGAPEFGAPSPGGLPEEPTRSIALPFTDGVVGEVSLVIASAFTGVMEAAQIDAELAVAAVPVLSAAADAIEPAIHVVTNPDWAGEIATDTLLSTVDGNFATVPILENDTRVVSVVVRIVHDEPAPAATPPPRATPVVATPPAVAAPMVSVPTVSAPAYSPAPAVVATAPAEPTGLISLHEFQPLGEGQAAIAAPRSQTLLNEVNMEVTAELGRRRLTVRDIMALQPGSVVELDRAAGSPVDVLVNGALVWHGEVVVVDDEFGIRVSEIVVDEF